MEEGHRLLYLQRQIQNLGYHKPRCLHMYHRKEQGRSDRAVAKRKHYLRDIAQKDEKKTDMKEPHQITQGPNM